MRGKELDTIVGKTTALLFNPKPELWVKTRSCDDGLETAFLCSDAHRNGRRDGTCCYHWRFYSSIAWAHVRFILRTARAWTPPDVACIEVRCRCGVAA